MNAFPPEIIGHVSTYCNCITMRSLRLLYKGSQQYITNKMLVIYKYSHLENIPDDQLAEVEHLRINDCKERKPKKTFVLPRGLKKLEVYSGNIIIDISKCVSLEYVRITHIYEQPVTIIYGEAAQYSGIRYLDLDNIRNLRKNRNTYEPLISGSKDYDYFCCYKVPLDSRWLKGIKAKKMAIRYDDINCSDEYPVADMIIDKLVLVEVSDIFFKNCEFRKLWMSTSGGSFEECKIDRLTLDGSSYGSVYPIRKCAINELILDNVQYTHDIKCNKIRGTLTFEEPLTITDEIIKVHKEHRSINDIANLLVKYINRYGPLE